MSNEDEAQPDEVPQDVTCSGGFTLPPLSVLLPKEIPAAFRSKES